MSKLYFEDMLRKGVPSRALDISLFSSIPAVRITFPDRRPSKLLLPVAYELAFHARCSIYLEKCMRKLAERQVLIWSNCSLLALVRLLYFYFFLKVFSESIIYARSFTYLEHCIEKSGEG